jgi:hypothetical protein
VAERPTVKSHRTGHSRRAGTMSLDVQRAGIPAASDYDIALKPGFL